MKILVLSPVFPDSPADGDRVRLFHWLRELGRRHQVTLACFADPARVDDGGASQLGAALHAVHRVPWPRGRRFVAAALGRLGGSSLNVASARSGAMTRLVDHLIATEPGGFDAVLAYRLKMAPYALRFKGPRFLDYCDCMTRYTERRAVMLDLQGHGLRAAFYRREAVMLAAEEAKAAGQFDGGFFNARQDAETVRAMAPESAKRLHVAANGVTPAPSRPAALRVGKGIAGTSGQAHQRGGAKGLVFVGHLAYPPNIDAVEWFVMRVLPLIRKVEPSVSLNVVGGDAPASLRRLASSRGVTFTGFVADTLPYLQSAAVSLCPVRSGAGRQNKLLEAFAAGTPCVATSLAGEGAEAVGGKHLLVADAPQAFADQVLRLLKEPVLGRRLAAQAKALLRRDYVWRANAAGLERVMLSATRRPLW